MGNIKLSNGKDLEERINALNNEVKNLTIEEIEGKREETPSTTKLNKRFVQIIMTNESITEKDIYSKFSSNEDLEKYIKEKGYKEKRKSRKKALISEDEKIKLYKKNSDTLEKIESILYDTEIDDNNKLDKIIEVFKNRDKVYKAELSKNNKIAERFTISMKLGRYKEKLDKLKKQYDTINKEIDDLDRIIMGN